MSRIRVALIGSGQMGSSHARVISESADAELGVVVDVDAEAAKQLAHRYDARPSTDLADAAECDVAVVATSTATHPILVEQLLGLDLPLLVEKPFTPTLGDLDRLLGVAEQRGLPIMCGFVERFNAAYRTLKSVMDGPPLHMLAVRHSPPAVRIASSVVNDLLLHDLDCARGVFPGTPRLVGSSTFRPAGSDWNEIADCSIAFPGGMATLSANRMAHRKVRALTVHTQTQSIEVDLLRQDVTVYHHVSQEMTLSDGGVGYRSSTAIDLPFVRHAGEPLSLQFAHFLDLVNGLADIDEERRMIRPAHVLAEEIECRAVSA